MIDFAIIVPNLNQSHFLPTAFESLKCQQATFATAVMDGGSNDDFNAVVENYADVVTYSQSQKDAGQSSAINDGSAKIKGTYISWLNADDYYFPDTLAYVKSVFNRHPEVDIVYGDAIHVDPEGNFLSYFPPARDFDPAELTYNCFICQPACFMRSEAFYNVGGVNPDLHYTMDWDLWCRLSQQGYKFLYVNKPLAAVRYYPETKTLGGNYKRLLELYRIEKRYGNRLIKRSWLGSYYYGLSFKKRNFHEALFFFFFKGLYEFKQKIIANYRGIQNNDRFAYGFHRWKPIINKKCTIHFPFYNEKPWKELHLKFKPHKKLNPYRVIVNNTTPQIVYSGGNRIVAQLDKPAPNYSHILIENMIDEIWELVSFSVQ